MGFYIYDSIITPFSWYSLLPIIGFSIFLFIVVAYQRGEFYWLTDKFDDMGRSITARCRKKPKQGRDAHVPWFVTGGGVTSHYGQTGGMMIPTFQGHLAAHPEASAQGAAAILNRDSMTPLDVEKPPIGGAAHHRGGHVRALTAVPVLINVSSLDEWSTTL